MVFTRAAEAAASAAMTGGAAASGAAGSGAAESSAAASGASGTGVVAGGANGAARGKAARRAAADEVAPGAEIVTREWDGRQARVVARLNTPPRSAPCCPSARWSRAARPRRRRHHRPPRQARLRSPAPARARPAPQRLSYTQLTDYGRCGYRFYLKRVLGLPDVTPPPPEVEPEVVSAASIPGPALDRS